MSKRDDIIAALKTDWQTVPALLETTGWKSPTLRGFISALGIKHGLKTERARANGVTSYRIAAAD